MEKVGASFFSATVQAPDMIALLPLVSAANVTFLCRCSCEAVNRFAVATCSDCTLDLCEKRFRNCKESPVYDYQTDCYQRGSLKDEIIVIIFLLWSCSFIAYMLMKFVFTVLQDLGVARRHSIALDEQDLIPLQDSVTISQE